MVKHDSMHTTDVYGAGRPFGELLALAPPEVQAKLRHNEVETPSKHGFDVPELGHLAVAPVAEVDYPQST